MGREMGLQILVFTSFGLTANPRHKNPGTWNGERELLKYFGDVSGIFQGICLLSFVGKGLSSKPSGKCIVVPNFCFLSWRLQKLATCLFFNFLYLCKVSETLDKLDIRHFIRVPPLMFCVFVIYQKNQRGDPCKMSNINVVHFF